MWSTLNAHPARRRTRGARRPGRERVPAALGLRRRGQAGPQVRADGLQRVVPQVVRQAHAVGRRGLLRAGRGGRDGARAPAFRAADARRRQAADRQLPGRRDAGSAGRARDRRLPGPRRHRPGGAQRRAARGVRAWRDARRAGRPGGGHPDREHGGRHAGARSRRSTARSSSRPRCRNCPAGTAGKRRALSPAARPDRSAYHLLRSPRIHAGHRRAVRPIRRRHVLRGGVARSRLAAGAVARRGNRPGQCHRAARRRAVHRHDAAHPPALGPLPRAALLPGRRPGRRAGHPAAARPGGRHRRGGAARRR